MAIAYLLMVHAEPAQAARLVRRLTTEEDLVVVHVDRKTPLAPFREAFAAAGVAPVLVRRRVWVAWAGWSQVRAELAGIRAVLRTRFAFSHLVLLSGADYPIRPTAEIQRFFADHRGETYLSWSEGDAEPFTDDDRRGNVTWRWSGDLHRLTSWCLDVRGRRFYFPDPADPRARWLPRRRIPRGLRAAQGSSWWNLTPEAVAEVLATLRRRPYLRLWFRFALSSDENLFQMLLLASPLHGSLVNEDLRFMHWDDTHPPTLTEDDLPEMLASAKLFARKVEPVASAPLLDALDAQDGTAGAAARAG